jgi:hypothetical protein
MVKRSVCVCMCACVCTYKEGGLVRKEGGLFRQICEEIVINNVGCKKAVIYVIRY